MLICPVRDCRLPLTRGERQVRCARGHSFDIARSGYINLLQPQDKKSKDPGDSKAAVAARRRLHDRGITAPLLDAIAAKLGKPEIVLDAGCGDGFYLDGVRQRTGCKACGIDLSIPAVDAAARRYPECEWIVANADRSIPYADGSFSTVISITARMNVAEFARVLRVDGCLLIAIPSQQDLIELRGAGRDRSARTVEAFAPHFQLIERCTATTTAELDEAAVEDVLFSIYRPMQPTEPRAMSVTLSLDLLSFRLAS